MKAPSRRGVPQPPAHPTAVTQDKFIRGAPGKASYPWKGPHVRDDLMMSMNNRQPERLKLMVEWLADAMGITQREASRQALEEWAIRQLEAFGVSKD